MEERYKNKETSILTFRRLRLNAASKYIKQLLNETLSEPFKYI